MQKARRHIRRSTTLMRVPKTFEKSITDMAREEKTTKIEILKRAEEGPLAFWKFSQNIWGRKKLR